MNDKWKNLNNFIEYSKDGILSKELFKTDKINATLFCMAKGTEMSEHTSTKEGFIFVIEGKGVFNLEGEDTMMLPGVLIRLGKNVKHSLKAEDNTSFLLSLTD
ncbi:MAG: cupin domain-containing protein [Flavobacteriales bacterium]|jgi:nitric oxide dioxygenase|nr:cupin domain-containing protein [Flavobacteriales bacterium]|tara:strand:+ start:1987 stop:2295 length:309 start_codon:yes stop_codon:yes gene_type:complete